MKLTDGHIAGMSYDEVNGGNFSNHEFQCLVSMALASLDKQEAVEGLVKAVENVVGKNGFEFSDMLDWNFADAPDASESLNKLRDALAAYRAQADKGVR